MPRRDRRARATGRLGVARGERYALIPLEVLESAAWAELNGAAAKVLVTLAVQYNGTNNGRLTLPLSAARALGVRSKDVLNRSLHALEEVGLVEITWQGGLPPLGCSCYALGWRAVDADERTGLVSRPAPNRWATWSPVEGAGRRRAAPSREAIGTTSSPMDGPVRSDSRTT